MASALAFMAAKMVRVMACMATHPMARLLLAIHRAGLAPRGKAAPTLASMAPAAVTSGFMATAAATLAVILKADLLLVFMHSAKGAMGLTPIRTQPIRSAFTVN